MTPPVCIVSRGARTPVGRHAASSAAAVRAGITALGEHPFMIDCAGNPMPGALDTQLDPDLMGPHRLLELAKPALDELFESVDHAELHLPMYLGLAEYRPGFTKADAEATRSGLARLHGQSIRIEELQVFAAGHASGLLALKRASDRIRQGDVEACLVGGVDSYFQTETMEWLDENRQLAGVVSRSGFVPGEGAAFVLLMSQRMRERLGFPALAYLLAASEGSENIPIKSSEICLGEGLTSTIEECVLGATPTSQRINHIICDINSERYRSEEWAFVAIRLSEYLKDPTSYLSPADCWGDVGAASGPLFAILASEAAKRGYARGPKNLLWASSERGLRCAALLDTESCG